MLARGECLLLAGCSCENVVNDCADAFDLRLDCSFLGFLVGFGWFRAGVLDRLSSVSLIYPPNRPCFALQMDMHPFMPIYSCFLPHSPDCPTATLISASLGRIPQMDVLVSPHVVTPVAKRHKVAIIGHFMKMDVHFLSSDLRSLWGVLLGFA